MASDGDIFEDSGKKKKKVGGSREEKITGWRAFDRPWEWDGEFTIRYFIDCFTNK